MPSLQIDGQTIYYRILGSGPPLVMFHGWMDTGEQMRPLAEALPGLLQEAERDALLIDPPRTGLPQSAARAIARAAIPRIVYVSCDPATLARDIRLFTEAGGLRLRSLTPLDLFPQTHHVECVARLDRA